MADLDVTEDARFQRALLAHLRQEFTAPAAAILGYVEILIEDATRLALDGFLPDLHRIQQAGTALQNLLQAVLAQTGAVIDPRKLRHDLRTPMNAIKGYGEMLIEDAANAGRETFLDDLSRLLAAVEGVLARIDALVDFTGQPADPTIAARPIDQAEVSGALRVIRAAGLEHGRSAERAAFLLLTTMRLIVTC
jgi:signal transduction histidine kinase